MNKETLISSIVNLPENFYSLGNISIYSLLKETGYFEMYNQVDEINIVKELIRNPEYINQWLSWSEDKRSCSGWYFKQNGDNKYIVGYYPAKEDLKTIEYSDIKEACAAFIKREIEDIRKN